MRYFFIDDKGNYVIWATSYSCVANSLRRGLINGRSCAIPEWHELYRVNVIDPSTVYALDNDGIRYTTAPVSSMAHQTMASLTLWREIAQAQETLHSFYETNLSGNRFFPQSISSHEVRVIVGSEDHLTKYALGRNIDVEQCRKELTLLLENYDYIATYSLGIYQKYVEKINAIRALGEIPAIVQEAFLEMTKARG